MEAPPMTRTIRPWRRLRCKPGRRPTRPAWHSRLADAKVRRLWAIVGPGGGGVKGRGRFADHAAAPRNRRGGALSLVRLRNNKFGGGAGGHPCNE